MSTENNEIKLGRFDFFYLNVIMEATLGEMGYISIEEILNKMHPNMEINKSTYTAGVTAISRLRERLRKVGIDISNRRANIDSDIRGYRIESNYW